MTSDAEPPGRRIVVGIDGSAAAAAALGWAFREAVLRDAVLHVVHAWEPAARGRAPYAPGPCDLGPEAGRHAAEALLAAAVRHAYHAAGLAPATSRACGWRRWKACPPRCCWTARAARSCWCSGA